MHVVHIYTYTYIRLRNVTSEVYQQKSVVSCHSSTSPTKAERLTLNAIYPVFNVDERQRMQTLEPEKPTRKAILIVCQVRVTQTASKGRHCIFAYRLITLPIVDCITNGGDLLSYKLFFLFVRKISLIAETSQT